MCIQPLLKTFIKQMSNLSITLILSINCSTNGVSVLVCLLAAFLVYRLGLYRTMVYRLSLYQVLASLAFATAETLEIIFVNYQRNPQVYERACIAIGWMIMYTRWVKVLFTTCVTFHLFYFAVLHKNLKRFEILYVVTSLLIPALIAAIPLMTSTYGVNRLGMCFLYTAAVNDTSNIAKIELFSLWYGPAIVILFLLSFN